MREENRKNISKTIEKWTPFFIIACTFLGSILGSFLVYFVEGYFPYEVVVSGLVAITILTVIQVIKQQRKKDNLPETDERVTYNIFRFFAFTSHMFLAILLIALAVFTLIGNESISMLYLWIFFFSYIWIAGIGALIIKRR
ncbi:hypothetical protein LC087_00475 [Bacillus carboniphilus]|uniref:DUF2178 domain-containing protein n=1 Tax=Bacillus carboniphilus TaxID=86663 RepID=A0ABY9JTN6_9BACI|nr:hypothetical protein [Bacillus carboniphilus]WLR42759.1 hypothetical protein LC087_00475 [Bacillus carboniphilus]